MRLLALEAKTHRSSRGSKAQTNSRHSVSALSCLTAGCSSLSWLPRDQLVTDMQRALRALPFVDDLRLLVREHGRYIYAEVFITPNDKMPSAIEASLQVRQAIMPLDWRLQHAVVEFTDDVEEDSRVLTREELEIETA